MSLCLFLLAGCSSPDSEPVRLRLAFDEDGKFRIVQFTDIHWAPGDPTVARTVATIKGVLAAEKPDMVVITGDAIWKKTERAAWKELSAIFEEAEVPFAVTFGNHDGEVATDITRPGIVDILLESPCYVGEKGPEDIQGVGNYVVPVYGRNDKTAALLYCFDSNSYSTNPKAGGYQPVFFDQIAWYRRQSESYTAENGGKPLPALAFFHIPLPEHDDVFGQKNTIGAGRGAAGGASYNTGLFGSFFEKEDVMGAFVGHLHGNDYIGVEKYIALGFGRVTGWGAGGSKERGARVIELYENEFVFDTWIRTGQGVELVFNYPTTISSVDEETMTYLPAKNVNPTRNGVAYSYYEGKFGTVKNIDTAMKAGEGEMNNFSIQDAPASDYFAYEFRTLIKIPERGVYSFHTTSDDDSQIYVDGVLTADKPGTSVARVDGKVALEAGFHELKVLYYQDSWGKLLEVGYASKNIRDGKVPDEVLYLMK